MRRAGREPVWLQAGRALGVAFLVLHVIPLEEWIICLALGSPLSDSAHRGSLLHAVRGFTGVTAVAGAGVAVVASAIRRLEEPSLRRAASVALVAPVAAACVALGVGPAKYVDGAGATAFGFVVSWVGAGLVFAWLGGNLWQRWLPAWAGAICAAACVLFAGGAAAGLLLRPLPFRCLNYQYEGTFGLSLPLVTLTATSFGLACILGARRQGAVSGVP